MNSHRKSQVDELRKVIVGFMVMNRLNIKTGQVIYLIGSLSFLFCVVVAGSVPNFSVFGPLRSSS
jgi:hypothetical protein